MPCRRRLRALSATLALPLVCAASAVAALPKVPEGFECRLVATVPAVLYPCQVATAPGGRLFVAEDPMDQVGPYESFHGRILLFRDEQDPVVFAEGFRAVQGMAWRDGALYVSHMPFLTVVRDTNGDGKSDERKDLFKDLGPTNNQVLNDHIVSGIQFGIDGYLYISVGDKGVPGATRPEDGQKVQLKGGGTLRCRPDGTALEVYSSGTRNHLEANLDERDNLFTYDNTDDGDGWWTRVTHHVDGGYYGYPYDYHGRPDRHLPRMAEYGGGSPCGAVVYREDAWPEKYRGVGFWAEWGKGKVHAFRFAPQGSTFQIAEAIDFAVPEGVENFHPIDLAVSHDGQTMYIADWGMGGWGSKTEKVGRVYAVTPKNKLETRPRGTDADAIPDQIRALDHPSYNERMRAQLALIKQGKEALAPVTTALANASVNPLARRHLLWALDGIAGGTPEAAMPLLDLLKSSVGDLRAQAARALGERAVPIAVGPLISILNDPEPPVRLQAIIALGRIGDGHAVPALLPVLADPDAFLAFSARQALRRIGDWNGAAAGLLSADPKVRSGVLATMEQVYDSDTVAALVRYSQSSNKPADERSRALLALAQVHRRAKPWDGKWWGTRPTQGKPPAKEVEWVGTKSVLGAISGALADPVAAIRIAAVGAVTETADRGLLPELRARFATDADPGVRAEIARALGKFEDKEAPPLLVAALRDPQTPAALRDAVLAGIEAIGGEISIKALVEFLGQADLAANLQARVIDALGRFRAQAAVEIVLSKLTGSAPEVRAAAATALGKIGRKEGVTPKLLERFGDSDEQVKKAAIAAVGTLKDPSARSELLKLAQIESLWIDAALALAEMPNIQALAVYLRGLAGVNPQLRAASSKALESIREQAAPVLDQLYDRKEIPARIIPDLQKIFLSLQPIRAWQVIGPFPRGMAVPFPLDGPIDLKASHKGLAELESKVARKAQVIVGSDDTLTVWLNGLQVYDFQGDRGFDREQGRFEVDLVQGKNRLLTRCANSGGAWQFAVSLSAPVDHAFLKAPASGGFDPDTFKLHALRVAGEAAKGKALFSDLKGLACVKCHAIGGQGGTVGPDLTGIGGRYSKPELIESVLYPSAKIFSGYESVIVATVDGRVLTGIIKSDTPEGVEILDAEAQRVKIAKGDIDERKPSAVSLMPNGLAAGLEPDGFADLIAYLESLKEKPAASGK